MGSPVFKTGGGSRGGPRWVRLPSTPAFFQSFVHAPREQFLRTTMIDPVQFVVEEEPPRFLRAQALPYPELKRVWTRVELTPFARRPGPELEMALLDPDGREAAAMTMVDVQHTYVSLTMHLRQPLPGARYTLLLRLTRDDALLDQRAVPFDLVFVERDAAMAEAEALTWTERAVPITPLPDEPDPAPTNGVE